MKFRKKQRVLLLSVAFGLLCVAVGLALYAFRTSIALFATPSQIANNEVEVGRLFRIGGLVDEGSVVHGQDGEVRFVVTDGVGDVQVSFVGLLPDLFREGQGIVATGTLIAEGEFKADEVLAKHDETYVPKEVADALKASGQWKGGSPSLD